MSPSSSPLIGGPPPKASPTERTKFTFPSRSPPAFKSDVKTLPELPRRINRPSSTLKKLKTELDKSDKKAKKGKKDEEDEDADVIPFTVIRVSSSVSQVRPEIKVDGEQNEEEEQKEVIQLKTSKEPSKPNAKKETEKKKFPSRNRSPFLRPAAKFPEIKIAEVKTPSSILSRAREKKLNATKPPKISTRPTIRIRQPGKDYTVRPPIPRPTQARKQNTAKLSSVNTRPRTRPTIATKTPVVFTKIPFRENSIFVTSNQFVTRPTTESATTEATTAESKLETTSITSDSFRPLVAFTTSTTESSTEAEEEQTSISSDTFRARKPTVRLRPATPPAETTTAETNPATTSTTEDENYTPAASTTTPFSPTEESTTESTDLKEENRSSGAGRGSSRFQPNRAIQRLLGRRKPFLKRPKSPVEETTKASFINRFRSTSFTLEDEVIKESTTPSPDNDIFVPTRKSFLKRIRISTTEAPPRPTPFRRRNRFRSTRTPFVITSPDPLSNDISSTERIPDNDRSERLEDLMKKDKKVKKNRDEKKLVTIDYPFDIEENDFGEEDLDDFPDEEVSVLLESEKNKKRKGVIVKVPKKVEWNPTKTNNDASSTTSGPLVTPRPISRSTFTLGPQARSTLTTDAPPAVRFSSTTQLPPRARPTSRFSSSTADIPPRARPTSRFSISTTAAPRKARPTSRFATTVGNTVRIEQSTVAGPSTTPRSVRLGVARSSTERPAVPRSTTTADPNQVEEEDVTESFFITPFPALLDPAYDPCSISDACGPNAKCTPRGSEPVCSCPVGFSGIPRDGVPDPAHGCVRTPEKCVEQNSAFFLSNCPEGQSCVRSFCLPKCTKDQQCSLGERCVDGNCIKICFYDAHCLAGEFCEKTSTNGNNGVCLAGCRRDTNCPFGQICVDDKHGGKKCEDGCHFNNDCGVKTACVNHTCSDPCIGFSECGTNAVCEVVSHAPTCKCPSGFRELNSPYVACVPAKLNLARIECLKDSDCATGLDCIDWQCSPG